MPYRVERSGGCPADKPYALIKKSNGEVVACHASKANANRQIAAIYASEGKVSKGDYAGHPFRGNQWSDAKAVNDYQMNGIQINADLRSGKRTDGPLDTLMHAGPAETLYRTVSNANGYADKLAVNLANGNQITDMAYVSTSRDELTASDMDPVGDGLMLRILLPEGAPRLDMANHETAYDQSEVVLPRQTVLTPTGPIYESNGRKTINVVGSTEVLKASKPKATHIANLDNDKLFFTHYTTVENGLQIPSGYIQTADGATIPVPNIDSLLARGFWVELPPVKS